MAAKKPAKKTAMKTATKPALRTSPGSRTIKSKSTVARRPTKTKKAAPKARKPAPKAKKAAPKAKAAKRVATSARPVKAAKSQKAKAKRPAAKAAKPARPRPSSRPKKSAARAKPTAAGRPRAAASAHRPTPAPRPRPVVKPAPAKKVLPPVKVVKPAPVGMKAQTSPAAKAGAPAAAPRPLKVSPRTIVVPATARSASSGKGSAQTPRISEARPRPQGPPRSAAELAAFRERLTQKRAEILALYRRDLQSGLETSDEPTEDIVDRANNSYSRELSFSISDAERSLLIQIDEALKRLENGAFGSCGHCGRAVSAQRLEALPWARLCIDCQELLEKGLLSEG